MATKPKSKLKSRINKSKSNNLTQFTFRWWMALILVAVVAVIGIVVLRFSRASGPTVSYNASQIQSLPYYQSTNTGVSGGFKGAGAINLRQAGARFNFRLQLFPGNYVICAHGLSAPEGSGRMDVVVNKVGAGQIYKNDTSAFTPTNTTICVAFDTYNTPPTGYLDYSVHKGTNTGYVDITAITIEAR